MARSLTKIILITLLASAFPFASSLAWHDHTHLAVAKAAGYAYWFNAAGADITKIKAGAIEEKNHYYNNYANAAVTDKMVIDQIKAYNSPSDEEGHLYGAIIAALRDYKKKNSTGKYAEYYMAFAVHYIADLSQPLHNVQYDQFNKTHHSINDGIVDADILEKMKEIEKNMYEIKLSRNNYEAELSKEIARISNISRQLAFKMKDENRNMTKEEAYIQLGHCASLLKAVLKVVSSEAIVSESGEE